MTSDAQAAADQAEHIPGWGAGRLGRLLFGIAVAFSAFQLWTAAYSPLPSQVVRSVHVGFLLLLFFGLVANAAGGGRRLFWSAAAVIGFLVGLYHWVFYQDLILRAGMPDDLDLAVGVVAVALVFLAGVRMIGPALPIICAVFLAYALWGHLLPSPLDHRPYAFDQVVDILFLGTEGIYGTPIYVSSSYIFLFILFGSFLERAGMIQLFTDVSLGLVGHTRGGPAKVSVVSSGLMGTINGSGVANVVTTGAFTIPLMKRYGFRPAFAGGVEATASMGGQIMPPVMGAVAFIMAETLGVEYVTIVKAAIVPALLYFLTVFWMVHLESGRLGLWGLPKAELPSALGALRARWFLTLPLAALIYLLFSGYTPLFAGTVGLGLTVLIVLGGPVSNRLPLALRVLFWVALGLLAAAAFGTTFRLFGTPLRGITLVLALIALLVAVNLAVRGGRATLRLCLESLGEGARNALPVGVACALVGVIIGVLVLTGAATTFAIFIVSIGQHSLFLSLVLTMLTCLVLGMGIPTIPNYIITSSIAGPALLQLGVPLIVSHMFVFYFGIMADLTPPVALAAFAAAPIARESGMKIGLQAVRVAAAGFVVPFMAVYAPTIMLQDGGPLAQAIGFWPAVAVTVTKAVIAIGLWGATAIGWAGRPLAWWERLWSFAAAALLIASLPLSDEAGLAAGAAFAAWVWWRTRAAAPAAG
ncbi:TRAP transporter, 4TM/12TM fusion protein [Tistlia consotensis]|uniref:TRAP transporter, 4TM/12TM fusion protein n=1 Tax=Tistlia consotensis USBA 355 TaxID=560819 RepID=A0A1Y6BHL4_9PROT|nr:TRAP transporter permease [Tistlia consotensis]SMF07949.1 TRAP transporter, 4TM/12TM fusion protein [Tistlia consotensis USBA 355]SNR35623.1 TRAP transporter, 4TM/12TM fusion protein [Tistlia consotensis]